MYLMQNTKWRLLCCCHGNTTSTSELQLEYLWNKRRYSKKAKSHSTSHFVSFCVLDWCTLLAPSLNEITLTFPDIFLFCDLQCIFIVKRCVTSSIFYQKVDISGTIEDIQKQRRKCHYSSLCWAFQISINCFCIIFIRTLTILQ